MEFHFYSPTKLISGNGVRKEVGKRVSGLGKKCLIVRTPISEADWEKRFEELTTSLSESGIEYTIYDGVRPNPTTDLVEEGVEKAKANDVDFILGYGGGSSLDTAKAIALFAKNPDLEWKYCFETFSDAFPDTEEPLEALPVVAVTTTSGTGSHVTQASVITDSKANDKLTIFHSSLIPKIGIVDPELMISLPKRMTAITGFDALAHATESYFNPRASVLTKMLSLKAIELVVDTLPKLIEDLGNVEYREKMAYADTLAGVCLSNAGAEAPHPIGEIINGYFPEAAHGETLAFVYPTFLKYVSDLVPEKARALMEVFKEYVPKEQQGTLGETTCQMMENFLKAIELDDSLSALDMSQEIIDEIKNKLAFNLPLTTAENLKKIFVESLAK